MLLNLKIRIFISLWVPNLPSQKFHKGISTSSIDTSSKYLQFHCYQVTYTSFKAEMIILLSFEMKNSRKDMVIGQRYQRISGRAWDQILMPLLPGVLRDGNVWLQRSSRYAQQESVLRGDRCCLQAFLLALSIAVILALCSLVVDSFSE